MINSTKQLMTPKLRFSEFNNRWEEKKLEDFCSFFSGGTPVSTNKDYYSGDIPFIGSGDISSKTVGKYITKTALKNSSAKLVEAGDLLYALYGATSGEVSISKISGAINQAVLCIRSEKNIFFLKEWLMQRKGRIVATYLQGGQGNLSAKIVKSLKITMPSKDEELKKISSFLSSIDYWIENLEKQKSSLEEYKKGMMKKIFSQEVRFKGENGNEFLEWNETLLGDITNIYDGTHQTPNYVKKGIPFYSVEHVTSNNFENTKFITEEIYNKEIKKVSLEKNDILMTRIGDIGTARLIDWDVKASFYVSLALIKNSKFFNSSYLTQYIASEIFQRELWRLTIHVAFPKKINLGEINKCIIKLPTLEEQGKIATFLSTVDKLTESKAKQIKKAKEWKKGLLQQMFV